MNKDNNNRSNTNMDNCDIHTDFLSVNGLTSQLRESNNEEFEYGVIETINGVLNNDFGDGYYRNGYVSLSDVFSVMVNKRSGFVGNKNSFVFQLEMALNDAFKYHVYYYNHCKNINICVPKVSFDPDEISFVIVYDDNEKKARVVEEIKFTKVAGKVKMLNSPSTFIKDVFSYIEPVFSNFFDTFQKFKLWKEPYNYNVETSIPDFFVKFQNYDIKLYCHSARPERISSPFFRVSGHCHKNKLYCNSSSGKILNTVSDNANKLFDKVFVKISDCPVWCQDELRNINAKKVEEADAKDKKESWIWPFKRESSHKSKRN